MRKLFLSLSLGLLCAGFCAAQKPSPASLAGLELGWDKSNLEYVPVKLNEKFSPSTMNYTADIEARTKLLLITPRLSSPGATVRINGAEAKPSEKFQVPVALGENKISIAVTSPGGESTAYQLAVSSKDLSKVYWSEPIGKGMWRIEDFGGAAGNEDMYLIEGKDKALLVDTGMGKGDLAAYVRTLTKLPIEVALTHAGPDHRGQVDQFADSVVYMSELDITRTPQKVVTPKFKFVKTGDVIDLGNGRKFEIFSLPGHTYGSIMFIDYAHKVGIMGDAVGSGSMLFMYGSICTALDEYLAELKKFEAKLKGLDGLDLYVGHHYQERVPLKGAAGKQTITDMRIACEKVLSGELVGKQAFMIERGNKEELRQASYGLVSLWYNPSNLVTDPAALKYVIIKTAAGACVYPQPSYSSMVTAYTAFVPADVAKIKLTPTAYWPNHKGISINGKPVKSGAMFAADLADGPNKIEIAVTSAKGTVRTYTFNVSRGGAPAQSARPY